MRRNQNLRKTRDDFKPFYSAWAYTQRSEHGPQTTLERPSQNTPQRPGGIALGSAASAAAPATRFLVKLEKMRRLGWSLYVVELVVRASSTLLSPPCLCSKLHVGLFCHICPVTCRRRLFFGRTLPFTVGPTALTSYCSLKTLCLCQRHPANFSSLKVFPAALPPLTVLFFVHVPLWFFEDFPQLCYLLLPGWPKPQVVDFLLQFVLQRCQPEDPSLASASPSAAPTRAEIPSCFFVGWGSLWCAVVNISV